MKRAGKIVLLVVGLVVAAAVIPALFTLRIKVDMPPAASRSHH